MWKALARLLQIFILDQGREAVNFIEVLFEAGKELPRLLPVPELQGVLPFDIMQPPGRIDRGF